MRDLLYPIIGGDLVEFEVRDPDTVRFLRQHFGGCGSIRKHRVTYLPPEKETGLPRIVVPLEDV